MSFELYDQVFRDSEATEHHDNQEPIQASKAFIINESKFEQWSDSGIQGLEKDELFEQIIENEAAKISNGICLGLRARIPISNNNPCPTSPNITPNKKGKVIIEIGLGFNSLYFGIA